MSNESSDLLRRVEQHDEEYHETYDEGISTVGKSDGLLPTILATFIVSLGTDSCRMLSVGTDAMLNMEGLH